MANQYAQPQLGYGKQSEFSIDQVNKWMRAQPWYQQIRGTAPKLNEAQRRQILRAAQAQGVVIDEGDIEVDPSGNLNPKGHKLRNTLIVAGIAGATLATLGAAGAFSGAAAAGTGGFSTAAGAGGFSAGLPSAIGGGAAAAAGGGVGAGTLATVGAGAAGASKVKNWLAPLLQIGVPVAGQLIGAGIEAKGNREAADLADRRAQEAIAYEKEQDAYNRQKDEERYRYGRDLEASRYGELTGRLSPYLQAGAGSTDRMAQLLGLPARAAGSQPLGSTAAPAVQAGGPVPAPTLNTQPAAPPQPMAAQMVTMQAPDGTQRPVPADQIEHYRQRGAVVVGAA